MMKYNNNYAIIDSQNVNLSIQAQGWKLDFTRFRKYLSDKYGVSKAFYLSAMSLLIKRFILIYKKVVTF